MKKELRLVLLVGLCILITILVTMILFNVSDYGITVASYGATVFMLFSKKSISKKKIFGAYFIATIIGFLFSKLPTVTSFNVALATISSFVLMTIFSFQHAPALGVTVAMVLNKFSFLTDIIVLFCIFLILSIAYVLKLYLSNPEKIINFVKIETEKISWNF